MKHRIGCLKVVLTGATWCHWLQEHLQSPAAAGTQDADVIKSLVAFVKNAKEPGELGRCMHEAAFTIKLVCDGCCACMQAVRGRPRALLGSVQSAQRRRPC
jgi:hypothetical protein